MLRRTKAGLTHVVVALLIVACTLSVLSANELTLIGPFGGFGSEFKETIALFEKESGIQVNVYVATGWDDMSEKTLTMIAGGAAPDIVYSQPRHFNDFSARDLLLPLDTFIARDRLDMNLYPQRALEFCTRRGHLVALPTALSIQALYVHTDISNAYGVGSFTQNWADPAWRLDDFVAVAKKLTRDLSGDGIPDLYGTQSFDPLRWIGIFGLRWLDEEALEFLGNRSEHITAYEQLTALWTHHEVVGGNIQQGTAATSVRYANSLELMRDNLEKDSAFNWILVPLPWEAEPAPPGSVHGLAIIEPSRNHEAAWKLLRHLAYDKDGNRLYALAENRIPVLRSSVTAWLRLWIQMFPESRMQIYTDAFPYAYQWEPLVLADVWNVNMAPLFIEMNKNVTRGNLAPAVALAEIKPIFDAYLKQQ
ncbi:MAG: extracellular solute-binding protein [Limnochordia bacterium]|jgi:multiple sugar transport system substrate-binding protein